MTKKELKKEEAKIFLLTNYIKPNIELLINIISVSRSGMSRRIKVYIGNEPMGIRNISYLIADLCDLSMNDKGLKITGCGMDITFWLAERITQDLYRDNGMSYADYQKKCKAMGLNENVPCLDYMGVWGKGVIN